MKTSYFETANETNKLNIKKTGIVVRQAIDKLNDNSNYPNTFIIYNRPVVDTLSFTDDAFSSMFNYNLSRLYSDVNLQINNLLECFVAS